MTWSDEQPGSDDASGTIELVVAAVWAGWPVRSVTMVKCTELRIGRISGEQDARSAGSEPVPGRGDDRGDVQVGNPSSGVLMYFQERYGRDLPDVTHEPQPFAVHAQAGASSASRAHEQLPRPVTEKCGSACSQNAHKLDRTRRHRLAVVITRCHTSQALSEQATPNETGRNGALSPHNPSVVGSSPTRPTGKRAGQRGCGPAPTKGFLAPDQDHAHRMLTLHTRAVCGNQFSATGSRRTVAPTMGLPGRCGCRSTGLESLL